MELWVFVKVAALSSRGNERNTGSCAAGHRSIQLYLITKTGSGRETRSRSIA
jgi:hypothetical protein